MADTPNIVTVRFQIGQTAAIADGPLFQYDSGQILKISGLELPDYFEVHFSNRSDRGSSVSALGTPEGVPVPTDVLQSGAHVYAFIYLSDASSAETVRMATIYVIARPQLPDDTPTQEQTTIIQQAISALNEQTGVATTAASTAVAAAASALVNLAPTFSASDAYETGDYVLNDGALYVFTADHAAGVWTADDAEAVTVGGELDMLAAYDAQLWEQSGEVPYWGRPKTLAPSFDGTSNVRLGVDRIGPYVALSGQTAAQDGTDGKAVVVKLHGRMRRMSSSNSNDSAYLPADLALHGGHTYVFTIRRLSGGWTPMPGNEAPNVAFRVRDGSNNYSVTSGALALTPASDFASETVTVAADVNVKIDLFVRDYLAFDAGTELLVEIQDLTAALEHDALSAQFDSRLASLEASVPKAYTLAEADAVAEKVRNVQTGTSLTFLAVSDLHAILEDELPDNSQDPADLVRAAPIMAALDDMRQGVKAVLGQLHVDYCVCFGDLIYRMSHFGDFEKGTREMLAATKILNDAFGYRRQFRLVGNHDTNSSGETGYYTQPQLNAFFGAYSEDLVKSAELPYGSFGYHDFATQKVRLIVINTSFYGRANSPTQGGTTYLIGSNEGLWLAQTLDLSEKADAAEWQIVVMSHVPIDKEGHSTRKMAQFSGIFDAYQRGALWYLTSAYKYDFTGKNAAALALYINGHGHKFFVKNLCNVSGSDGAILNTLAMAQLFVANALPGRDQESFDGLTYTKTPNTAQSTAFQVVTIDFENKIAWAHHFGAGIDVAVHYEPTTEASLTTTLTSPTWFSVDPSIATVSGGAVTPVAAGHVIIAAKSGTDGMIECWNYTAEV